MFGLVFVFVCVCVFDRNFRDLTICPRSTVYEMFVFARIDVPFMGTKVPLPPCTYGLFKVNLVQLIHIERNCFLIDDVLVGKPKCLYTNDSVNPIIPSLCTYNEYIHIIVGP